MKTVRSAASDWCPEADIVVQSELLGTGHAVAQARQEAAQHGSGGAGVVEGDGDGGLQRSGHGQETRTCSMPLATILAGCLA